MKTITKRIQELNLFTYQKIDVAESDHLDDGDQFTLLINDQAQLVLRVSDTTENAVSHAVYLEVDEFDIYGETFLNDTLWSEHGTTEEILAVLTNKDWDLKSALGCYHYLFKNEFK